jgi:hypothetical protein
MNKNIADWIMEIVERNVEAHYTQNNRLGIWEEERLNSFSGAEAHISRLIYRRNRKEGGSERGREGRREGGREGGREEGREGGREGGEERYQKQTNV